MTNRALSPELFGREAQLRELHDALEHVRGGAGRLVFVAGEAGVGKTRLVQEFTRGAAAAGAEVLRGQCFDVEPAEPYTPFLDLLRTLELAHGQQTLADAAGPWAGELGRLLPGAPPALPAPGEPHGEKRRLFEAIYRVLRPAAAGGVRVVVLEDLHWADQTSQDLVHFLARAIARDRVLLVGTYRLDELHRRHPLPHLIAQLTRERLYHEVRLAPLAHPELAQMLEASLGRQLPPSFVAALYERTEGNPFFAEEVLGTLLARGRLDALVQAARERRRLDVPELPLSVRDGIMRRTAGLDDTATAVLRYAAVIGRRFDFDLLAELTRLPEAGLLRALGELVERQLVVEDLPCLDERVAEDRYRFRHELVREAVLEDLLRRERRMMHREVLLALEALHAARPDAAVDQLAYHALHARELERAARYGRMAGDRAAALSAYREALAHYELALEAGDDAADALERAELLTRLGHAAYSLGDVRRSASAWGEAHELFARLGERRRAADVLRWLGRAAYELGDTDTAFERTRAALAMLAGEPVCHELAMAHSALSHLYMLTHAARESIACAEQALALAEQLGDDAVTTHALNNIGVSLCELGDNERGIASLERSLELARTARLHVDAVRAFTNLGGQLTQLGLFHRAAALHREAVAYAERVGLDMRVALLLPKLAWIAVMIGEWDAAEEHIAQALRLGELGATVERSYLLMVRADLLLRRGRLDAAAELVSGLTLRPPTPLDCWDALNAAHVQALVAAARGELGRAAELVEEGFRIWDDGGRPRRAVYQLPDGVDIALRAGRPELAHALVDVAEQLLAGVQLTDMERASLEEARGVLLAPQGAPAEPHLRAALELWRTMRLPYEEGVSRRRLAGVLTQGDGPPGEEAAEHIEAARALFEALGALPELERLEGLRRGPLAQRRVPGRDQVILSRQALTPREREVLALLARGSSNRAIAEALVISEKTVEVHVSNILGKLGATSRTHAAALARDQGLAEAA